MFEVIEFVKAWACTAVLACAFLAFCAYLGGTVEYKIRKRRGGK
jgi:hypothetical protein